MAKIPRTRFLHLLAGTQRSCAVTTQSTSHYITW